MGALKTYASTKYVTYIDYLTPIFVDLLDPVLTRPKLVNKKTIITLKDDTKKEIDTASQEDLEEYRILLKDHLRDEKAVKAIKRSIYKVVLGQCSHKTRTKLKGDTDFEKIEVDGDVLKLLKKIRGVSCQMTANTLIYDSLDEAKRKYYVYRQQPEDDNEKHLRTFKSNFDVVKHYHGCLYDNPALIEYEKKQDVINRRKRSNDEVASTVKQKMTDTALLKRSDMSRYGPLMTDIRDQYGYGIDVYPKILTASHDLLEDYARIRKLYPKKKKQKILRSQNKDKERTTTPGVMHA